MDVRVKRNLTHILQEEEVGSHFPERCKHVVYFSQSTEEKLADEIKVLFFLVPHLNTNSFIISEAAILFVCSLPSLHPYQRKEEGKGCGTRYCHVTQKHWANWRNPVLSLKLKRVCISHGLFIHIRYLSLKILAPKLCFQPS